MKLILTPEQKEHLRRNFSRVAWVSWLCDIDMHPKCLPWGPVYFQLWVGQVWGIDQLHSLPHGMCKITERDIYRNVEAQAHITIGVYVANLTYSFQAGKFMVSAITEVRDSRLREDLWSIAGRSLQELLRQGLAVRSPKHRQWQDLGGW